MQDEIFEGGAVDNQTEAQKDKNFSFAEMVTAPAPVVWVEKNQAQWRKYPIRDQAQSGSCVCQTYAKELGILFEQKYGKYLEFSASFPYQKRGGPTNPGCNSTDIYSIFPKIGNVYESFMPSQFLSDAGIMAVKCEPWYNDLAKTYTVKRIALPIDFETVASTIQQTGKGVMVWFKFAMKDWVDKPFVSGDPIISGHSVTAVDACLVDGKKYLVIQDSWGLKYAMNGMRLISEEYFKARCFVASYLMTFETLNTETTSKERPKFKENDVASLQDCLKWEGLLANNVPSNGVLGNITKTALIAFQKRYQVLPTLGNFGPLTNAKLKELYV